MANLYQEDLDQVYSNSENDSDTHIVKLPASHPLTAAYSSELLHANRIYPQEGMSSDGSARQNPFRGVNPTNSIKKSAAKPSTGRETSFF